MKIRFFHLLFSLLFLPSLLLSQKEKAPSTLDTKALDAYIVKYVEAFGVPGLAIGIIENGKVVYEKGFGVKNTGKKGKVSPQTLFGIASLSKAFTAARVAQLVSEGKLKWNDPVIDHLPWFALNDAYVTREMRIRDLLCHRSGLGTFDGDLLWVGTDYERKEIVRRIRHLPLKHSFRANFGYQNVMYLAAGELIEEVTGKSWDQNIHDAFFRPLGMSGSNTSIRDIPQGADLALPHIEGKVIPLLNVDNGGPAASINSNVSDLLKWAQLWLNGGYSDGKQMLDEDVLNAVWTAHTPIGVSKFWGGNGVNFRAYGMGWQMLDWGGQKVISHSGGLPGYISELALVPSKNLGIVILTNGMTSLPAALKNHILDLLLKEKQDKDWGETYLKFKKGGEDYGKKKKEERAEARVIGTKPSLSLSGYTGSYTDVMLGGAEIIETEGALSLSLASGPTYYSSELEHWHHNTFRISFFKDFLPNGFVTFNFNSDGDVSGFEIDLPNPDLLFFNLNFKKD